MLRLTTITVWALIITTGQFVNGYTIASRNRDYTNGYSNTGSTSGFIGLSKDSHSDLKDQVNSGSAYIPSNSQRYSTISGNSHSNPSAGYSSAAYADSAQSNTYPSHSSNSPDALNSIANSYATDIHSSPETSPKTYTNGLSGSDGYSSGSGLSANGFSAYTGSQSSNAGGLSGNDHTSSIEYSSSSASTYQTPSSALTNYVIAGPKTAAHSASNHGHITSPFTSGSNFISNGHSNLPVDTHFNSYPGAHLSSYSGGRHGIPSFPPGNSHPSHSSYSDGPRFSASSLTSYLSPHSNSGPSNYIYSGATSPYRNGIPPFLLGASSNVSPTFSKGPGSFYPGAGGFAKSGNKFIIIKEGNHAALMHPGESTFPSRMYPGSSGFKVKSSGPFTSGPHPGSSNYVSNLHLALGYPGAGGGHHSGGPTNSYFAHQ